MKVRKLTLTFFYLCSHARPFIQLILIYICLLSCHVAAERWILVPAGYQNPQATLLAYPGMQQLTVGTGDGRKCEFCQLFFVFQKTNLTLLSCFILLGLGADAGESETPGTA